jgi:hypothetical protein
MIDDAENLAETCADAAETMRGMLAADMVLVIAARGGDLALGTPRKICQHRVAELLSATLACVRTSIEQGGGE